MKIRTSLVLACFALSVLPLGSIVLYSYHSSRSALESAYHAEAARLTAQMDRRLGNIRDVLEQRLAEVSALPNAEKENAPAVGNIMMTMGDAASLVDSIEIQPMVHPAPAAPAPLARPMVIDIPPVPIPRFTFTDTQREYLKRISALGRQLGDTQLSTEERAEIQKDLREAQSEFQSSMQEAQKNYQEELQNALKQRPPKPTREIAVEKRERQAGLLFGHRFKVPMTHQGAVVGQIQAHVSTEEVIRRLLGAANEDRSEITFAIDREGNVYTRTPGERQTLDRLGIPQRIASGKSLNDVKNWIIVQHRDPDSGLRVAVARPFGEDLEVLRKAAAKNFGYGVALIFVALIGIVPIANHITRDVEIVTRGAERIAHGDLTTRIPLQSKNEIGNLAMAFNRMAEDLSVQQERIVEQERAAIEYERKSAELEEARRFQLSMLPKEVPHHPNYDIAVFTHTATEVGGDYYDFHVEPNGAMSVTIGDATGHGARAGTMVAVIKALFAGYDTAQSPANFLRGATEKVRRMDLERMAMALQLARFDDGRVTIASAGMPPAYIHHRASAKVDEIAHSATPLGTLGDTYNDITLDLQAGDTLLFMSDGFPELMNTAGQQLGYAAACDTFAAAATAGDADGVIAELVETVRGWHGDQPPNDDVTFVVVRAI